MKDERGPGLDFMLCFIMFVWPADVREGLPALLSFCSLFILVLKFCSTFAGSRLLLPTSTNLVTLVPKPGRKEGHAVALMLFWFFNTSGGKNGIEDISYVDRVIIR